MVRGALSAEKKRRSGNLGELPQRDFARLRGQRLANFPAIVGFAGEFPSTSTGRPIDRPASIPFAKRRLIIITIRRPGGSD